MGFNFENGLAVPTRLLPDKPGLSLPPHGPLTFIPPAGFREAELLNSWLGVFIGINLYIGSRKFSPQEEELPSKNPGPAWDARR